MDVGDSVRVALLWPASHTGAFFGAGASVGSSLAPASASGRPRGGSDAAAPLCAADVDVASVCSSDVTTVCALPLLGRRADGCLPGTLTVGLTAVTALSGAPGVLEPKRAAVYSAPATLPSRASTVSAVRRGTACGHAPLPGGRAAALAAASHPSPFSPSSAASKEVLHVVHSALPFSPSCAASHGGLFFPGD